MREAIQSSQLDKIEELNLEREVEESILNSVREYTEFIQKGNRATIKEHSDISLSSSLAILKSNLRRFESLYYSKLARMIVEKNKNFSFIEEELKDLVFAKLKINLIESSINNLINEKEQAHYDLLDLRNFFRNNKISRNKYEKVQMMDLLNNDPVDVLKYFTDIGVGIANHLDIKFDKDMLSEIKSSIVKLNLGGEFNLKIGNYINGIIDFDELRYHANKKILNNYIGEYRLVVSKILIDDTLPPSFLLETLKDVVFFDLKVKLSNPKINTEEKNICQDNIEYLYNYFKTHDNAKDELDKINKFILGSGKHIDLINKITGYKKNTVNEIVK